MGVTFYVVKWNRPSILLVSYLQLFCIPAWVDKARRVTLCLRLACFFNNKLPWINILCFSMITNKKSLT